MHGEPNRVANGEPVIPLPAQKHFSARIFSVVHRDPRLEIANSRRCKIQRARRPATTITRNYRCRPTTRLAQESANRAAIPLSTTPAFKFRHNRWPQRFSVAFIRRRDFTVTASPLVLAQLCQILPPMVAAVGGAKLPHASEED